MDAVVVELDSLPDEDRTETSSAGVGFTGASEFKSNSPLGDSTRSGAGACEEGSFTTDFKLSSLLGGSEFGGGACKSEFNLISPEGGLVSISFGFKESASLGDCSSCLFGGSKEKEPEEKRDEGEDGEIEEEELCDETADDENGEVDVVVTDEVVVANG